MAAKGGEIEEKGFMDLDRSVVTARGGIRGLNGNGKKRKEEKLSQSRRLGEVQMEERPGQTLPNFGLYSKDRGKPLKCFKQSRVRIRFVFSKQSCLAVVE